MPFIGNLNPTIPTGADLVSLGDDEFRNLKQTLQDSFPGLDTQPWQKDDAAFDDEVPTWGQTKQALKDLFPVGYVMFTANNQNPSGIFSGTWEQIAQGRFLVGVGQGDDGTLQRNYPAGNDTVGEYQHELIQAELAEHRHLTVFSGQYDTVTVQADQAIASAYTDGSSTSKYSLRSRLTDEPDAGKSSETGDGTAHENSPPAFGLYMWQRTA